MLAGGRALRLRCNRPKTRNTCPLPRLSDALGRRLEHSRARTIPIFLFSAGQQVKNNERGSGLGYYFFMVGVYFSLGKSCREPRAEKIEEAHTPLDQGGDDSRSVRFLRWLKKQRRDCTARVLRMLWSTQGLANTFRIAAACCIAEAMDW